MSVHKLHDAIGMLDEELVSDVHKIRQEPIKSVKFPLAKYISVAACACVLVAGTVVFSLFTGSGTKGDTDIQPNIALENMSAEDIADTKTYGSMNDVMLGENSSDNKYNSIKDGKATVDNSLGLPHETSEEQYSEPTTTSPAISNNDTSADSVLEPDATLAGTVAGGETEPPRSNGNSFISSVNLINGITASEDITATLPLKYSIKVTDFSLDLFREASIGRGNEMISPISVLYAMSMAANGAVGDTLSQIEDTLGMKLDELNSFVYSYMSSLPNGDKYRLSMANSMWFKDTDTLKISEDFLGTLASYYSADIFKAPFNSDTVFDINNWVYDKTDGMIGEIFNDVGIYETVLINALAFEAEWDSIFYSRSVEEKSFTLENGTKKKAEFMNGTIYRGEKAYLEDSNTTGFVKYYKDKKYAFVALLPNEGITVEEYVNSLTGEKVNTLITGASEYDVRMSLPKFEASYENDMRETLESLGIADAFNVGKADFTGIGMSSKGNLYLSGVLHKTYIKVGEMGTKAAAVTAPLMTGSSAPGEFKTVELNRPFVYMIIDCENSIPLFFGTVTDIGE